MICDANVLSLMYKYSISENEALLKRQFKLSINFHASNNVKVFLHQQLDDIL